MTDRHPNSPLQLRELGHGVHDLRRFDTNDFRWFAVRLDPHETRLPIARSAETLSTKPPAVEVLLAGADGATFLALVSRG